MAYEFYVTIEAAKQGVITSARFEFVRTNDVGASDTVGGRR